MKWIQFLRLKLKEVSHQSILRGIREICRRRWSQLCKYFLRKIAKKPAFGAIIFKSLRITVIKSCHGVACMEPYALEAHLHSNSLWQLSLSAVFEGNMYTIVISAPCKFLCQSLKINSEVGHAFNDNLLATPNLSSEFNSSWLASFLIALPLSREHHNKIGKVFCFVFMV